MKLKIEEWILEKGYSTNIKKLFSESVICYRNGAYRASLIFSYIGFLTIIKETIIKSYAPKIFIPTEWNNLLSKINNDDTWEKEVYEALIRTSKAIFPLNDDLRLQVKYWKDRRNDCAHFKQNEIESHHTEAFWSFIKSNVAKMTVEGGMETLLNKFDEHFDDSKTPPNADFTNLVKDIETSVMDSELHTFFSKLKSRIDGRRFWYSDSDALKVYRMILDVTNNKIQESLIEYLKQDNRDINFLSANPDNILRLNYSQSEIRKLWKERIYGSAFNGNPYNIFAGLLRHNLIPEDQIDEANTEIISRYSQTDYRKLPENKDIPTLKANSFFETIHRVAIVEKDLDDFMWVNKKCDLIILFIENSPLKNSTVKCIFKMAESPNPSQWLIRELKSTFNKMPPLKVEFHSIASKKGYSIPVEFR